MKLKRINIKNVLSFIPPRLLESHKKTYGHLLVLAGSPGMTGAAHLASLAALRMGTGYVTLGVPSSLTSVMAIKLTEVIIASLSETDQGSLSMKSFEKIHELIKQSTALVIGPGLSMDSDTAELVRKIVPNTTLPLVLDADAILAFKNQKNLFTGTNHILTPHPGEFSALTAVSKEEILAKPEIHAIEFASTYSLNLVLKGHRTIVTNGKEIYVNTTGNPGLSSAGTGDVLAGMIGSLLAQGVPAFQAAVLGVYFHGKAGDLAAGSRGMMSLIASDLIAFFGEVLKPYEQMIEL